MVNILSNHVLLFEIHLIKLFSCQRVSFLTQPKIILTATEETLEPEQMQSVPAKDYGTFFSFTTVYNVALLFDLFFLYPGPCQEAYSFFFSQLWKTLLEFTCCPFQSMCVLLGIISF